MDKDVDGGGERVGWGSEVAIREVTKRAVNSVLLNFCIPDGMHIYCNDCSLILWNPDKKFYTQDQCSREEAVTYITE